MASLIIEIKRRVLQFLKQVIESIPVLKTVKTSKGERTFVAVVPVQLTSDELSSIHFGKRLTVHKEGGSTEAVRITDGQGQESSTDLGPDGSLLTKLTGKSPQGESNSLEVCRILIRRLNENGCGWGEPDRPPGPEEGVDCIACSAGGKLKIQVTRIAGEKTWRDLANSGRFDDAHSILEAVSELRKAIRRKELIPPCQRKDLVLALDAIDTTEYALRPVVESFRNQYRSEVQGLGFQAIWVVGPLETMTLRLD
jgi:hypothetical protein